MLSRPVFHFRPLFPTLVLCLGFALLSAPASMASDDAPDRGHLSGCLKIFSPLTVDLADGTAPTVTPETYLEYPLVVLNQDGKTEIRVFAADKNGSYDVALPPGRYLLDVQNRRRKHVRAKPQTFTVVSGQTVHVDMNMDTGIR
jgi:hypothetical protein